MSGAKTALDLADQMDKWKGGDRREADTAFAQLRVIPADAADQIAALKAELVEVKAELKEKSGRVASYANDCFEGICGLSKRLAKQRDKAEAEVAKVGEEREAVKAALATRAEVATVMEERENWRNAFCHEREDAEALVLALEQIKTRDRSLSHGVDPTMLLGPCGRIAADALAAQRKVEGHG